MIKLTDKEYLDLTIKITLLEQKNKDLIYVIREIQEIASSELYKIGDDS